MKKTVLMLVVLSFLVLTVGSVWAAWFDKEAAPQGKAVSQSKPILKTAQVITDKKAELNGTAWNIELWPMARPKGKSRGDTDVISFAENKVSSKNLSVLGYAPTGFSVRLEDDGTVIWETMQSLENTGTAFWRGDIGPDGIMRGVLSKRDARGNTVDFNFVSIAK